jgi:3-phosphoshikimate 1-carboxyvinyltransferase
MNIRVQKSSLSGTLRVPASKSHTIRALLIASLAEGTSTITGALRSGDTEACVRVLRQLGCSVESDVSASQPDTAVDLTVHGGAWHQPDSALDCGNSGTTLYLALSLAALFDFPVAFTGDEQLQRRSAGPLLRALADAGATVVCERGNDCVPLTITGPLTGGPVSIEAPTSQYLSSLLIAAGMTPEGMQIEVPLLNERPYVQMTLDWLSRQGVRYSREGWHRFVVAGNQRYQPFDRTVEGDYSSATFLFAAAAITGSEVTVDGLDENDSQGDKEVIDILVSLGCTATRADNTITLRGPESRTLSGGEFDLNDMPDALPALAIAGCSCSEPLRLTHVPQARQKETDRITVMREVIEELGGEAEELPDGLVVRPKRLTGGTVWSRGDHRVAMAGALAGMVAPHGVTITEAEVASITFPGFYKLLRTAGAAIEELE